MSREANLSVNKLAVSASVSCMDIGHLSDIIDEVNTSGISFWHYDVVDGRFNQCLI